MIIDSLKFLFIKDLDKLKDEIGLYKSDSNLWIAKKGILNSGGNLCCHLIGNLKHYIGAVLGGSGYVRRRNLEFSATNISSADLIKEIDETIAIISKTLDELTIADLERQYPKVVFKEKMTIGYFLIHLNKHLSYHLGQINYHRRLLN